MDRREYLEILSKAVQLNSTKFNPEILENFCRIGLEVLNVEMENLEERMRPAQYLCRICKFCL